MLCSMTAFGHSRLNDETGVYVCEIRSVNHRYLDVGLRLDENLRPAESTLRERVAAKLKRGKVDVSLKFTPSAAMGGRLSVNHQLLDNLLDCVDQLSDRCANDAPLDIVALMQWPGILNTQDTASDQSIERATGVFEQALDDHLAARIREGEQIRLMLEQRCSQLKQIVCALREYRPSVVARQRDKLQVKLQQLANEYDQNRLEQELVYAAQRLDIDEELDRLDVHMNELFNVLNRREAVGRRLDFLMQEFNRETNTVASKSNDSDATSHSVNMKVLIEQMREQVQNVE